MVSLRPAADRPDTSANVAIDFARVRAPMRALIGRIAADFDELARTSGVEDLDTAAVLGSEPALDAINISS